MKDEILSQITNTRNNLPKTFDLKKELLEFHSVVLSLLLPYVNDKPPSKIIQEFKLLGEKLFEAKILSQFEESLPKIQHLIISDAESLFNGDPAAQSLEEVFLCYPGFLAAASHRIAHRLFELEVPLMPRIISENTHRITGVDIHPGAKIGKNFCIDHATGIVIGETCDIGENVKIYQGVTLGALSVKKTLASKKRHPTIGDNVVIYANATLLGPITIGSGCVIGGNVWLDRSIEAYSKVLKETDEDFSI